MKKKIMLYGVFTSILLLISSFLPYFNIITKDEESRVISSQNLYIFNNLFSTINFILIIMFVIISIQNYKKIIKEDNKKTSNPFLLIILLMFIATTIITMEFAWSLIDWAANEASVWPSHSIAPGYYLFRVSLISSFIYIILLFILFFKEEKEKFIKILKKIGTFTLSMISVLLLCFLGDKYIPIINDYFNVKKTIQKNNNLTLNHKIINNYNELSIPENYIVIGQDITYENFYENYKNYIGKKVFIYGFIDTYKSKVYKSKNKYLNKIHLTTSSENEIEAYSIYYSDNKKEFIEKINEETNSSEIVYFGYFSGTIKEIQHDNSLKVNIELDNIYYMDCPYSKLDSYVGNTYYSNNGETIKISNRYATHLYFDINNLDDSHSLNFNNLTSSPYNGDNTFNVSARHTENTLDEKIQYYDVETTLEIYEDKIVMKGYNINFTYHENDENISNKITHITNNDIKIFYKK